MAEFVVIISLFFVLCVHIMLLRAIIHFFKRFQHKYFLNNIICNFKRKFNSKYYN